MTTITNGSLPTQTLPPVAPPNESGSSLQLLTFTRYVQNHPDLSRLLQEDMQTMTQDICLLVNGWLPTEEDLPSALHQTAGLVKTAVADLLSKKKPISALTIQKIHEIDEIAQAHATGVLYQALREKGLIPGEPSSNVEVQRAAIAAVDVTHVTVLNLSSKELRCVPEEISRFTALTELDLNRNQLTGLPLGIFDNLRALKELWLYHNQLTGLPLGIFDNLRALKELWLQDNQLRSLPPEIFDNLTALRGLYLNKNQISYLPPGIFDNLRALEVLQLNHNRLRYLSDNLFDNLTALKNLCLDNNQLRYLPAKIFDNLRALKELWLYHNQLTSLQDKIFDNLIALRTLDLSYNQLRSLPPGIFDKLTALRKLYLSFSQIRRLPGKLIDNLTALIELWLWGTPLEEEPSLPVGVKVHYV